MARNTLDGGEAILEALRNLGIKYIFSSLGSEWPPLWEALARQQQNGAEGPTFMSCWHEMTAVDMAIGYTWLTGEQQAVVLHASAAALHGTMAIETAQSTETPMVIMSGEGASLGENPDYKVGEQWYSGLGGGDSVRYLAPLVKWNVQVADANLLYGTVLRSGEMAGRAPRGPVHVHVPMEHMMHPWTPPNDIRKVPPPPLSRPMDADIEAVAALLVNSDDPFIVPEMAGRDPDAVAALVELADLLAMPVVGGRNSLVTNFPRSHPMWLGQNAYDHLKEADLILLVAGRTPWFPASKRPIDGPIVAIDESPLKDYLVYQRLHADRYLEGHVATTLRLLLAAVKRLGPDPDAIARRRQKYAARHAASEAALADIRNKAKATPGITIFDLCEAVAEVMPPSTIYVDETISYQRDLRKHLPTEQAQSYYRHMGGLGQGLGIALGMKLAAPERVVVAFIGDGTFLYNPVLPGLGAAKEFGLPILVLVCDNGGYAAMRNSHKRYYPDGAAKDLDIFFGDIDGPGYHKFAEPFGIFGREIAAREEIEPVLREALAEIGAGRAAVVNVRMAQ